MIIRHELLGGGGKGNYIYSLSSAVCGGQKRTQENRGETFQKIKLRTGVKKVSQADGGCKFGNHICQTKGRGCARGGRRKGGKIGNERKERVKKGIYGGL